MKCNHVYHGLATILSVVLLLGGCKDFLDVKPKGKDIPETIEHYNGMFNSTNLTSVTYTQVTELGTKLGVSTIFLWEMNSRRHKLRFLNLISK